MAASRLRGFSRVFITRLVRSGALLFGLMGGLGGGLAFGLGCGKPSAQTTPPGTTGLFTDPDDSAHPNAENGGDKKSAKKYVLDDRGKELYARVQDGDTADVMRFAEYVGAAGLIELSHAQGTRATALAAMEYTRGFSCAALLAEAAKDGTDDDARLALDSLHGLAARPRRATDVEDRAELTYACDTLGVVARDAAKKERADRATSVLRMLRDYGCDAGSAPFASGPLGSGAPSAPPESPQSSAAPAKPASSTAP